MLKIFFLAFTFLLIFSSCAKERSFERNPDPVANSGADTVLLKKYFLVQASNDTIAKYDYNYDSRNRIIRNHASFYFGMIPTGEQTILFSYAGNDSLPSMVKFRFDDLVFNDTDSSREYFFYNTSGELFKDSVIERDNNFALVWNYSYQPGFVQINTSFNDKQRSARVFTSNNLSSESDSLENAGAYLFQSKTVCTFDNKPNPFFRTEVKRPLYSITEHAPLDLSKPPQQNNPTEETISGSWVNSHLGYSYSYRTDGFPTRAVITDAGSGTLTTGYYIY